LAVFECAVSNFAAKVSWYKNNENLEESQEKKKYQILSIGEFRRLAVRDCLISETNSRITCKWGDIMTEANLYVTGISINKKN
jgi:hypothetical protein